MYMDHISQYMNNGGVYCDEYIYIYPLVMTAKKKTYALAPPGVRHKVPGRRRLRSTPAG